MRACCSYLNQGRGLSPLPQGNNDAQLFAQTRTLWIRQLNSFDFSIAEWTPPLQAFTILALRDLGPTTTTVGYQTSCCSANATRSSHNSYSLSFWRAPATAFAVVV